MASLADYIASLSEGRKAPLAGRSDPTQTSSSPLLSPRLTTPSARINNMMSSFTGAQAPRAPINNTVAAWHKAPWSENLRQDREELARLDEQRAETGWGNLMSERTRGGAPEIVEIDDEAYNRMTPEQRAAVDYNTAYYRAVEADRARQASGLEPDEVQRGKYDKATTAIFGENAGESYAPDTVALLQSLGGVNKGANIDDYLNLGGAMTEADILRLGGDVDKPNLGILRGRSTAREADWLTGVATDTERLAEKVKASAAENPVPLSSFPGTRFSDQVGAYISRMGLGIGETVTGSNADLDATTGLTSAGEDVIENPYDMMFQFVAAKENAGTWSLAELNESILANGLDPDEFRRFSAEQLAKADELNASGYPVRLINNPNFEQLDTLEIRRQLGLAG